MEVELESLGFDEGGHLLVKRALRMVPAGHEIVVAGAAPDLDIHLRAWCRSEGHFFRWEGHADGSGKAMIQRGKAELERWAGSGQRVVLSW
ncbi:MAG: ferritin-like domain-containing protein, partial [Bryobacteraceae bacterium]